MRSIYWNTLCTVAATTVLASSTEATAPWKRNSPAMPHIDQASFPVWAPTGRAAVRAAKPAGHRVNLPPRLPALSTRSDSGRS